MSLDVSNLLKEKSALSPAMAVRLGILLSTSAGIWLKMQQARDLWEMRQEAARTVSVKPLPKLHWTALEVEE